MLFYVAILLFYKNYNKCFYVLLLTINNKSHKNKTINLPCITAFNIVKTIFVKVLKIEEYKITR